MKINGNATLNTIEEGDLISARRLARVIAHMAFN